MIPRVKPNPLTIAQDAVRTCAQDGYLSRREQKELGELPREISWLPPEGVDPDLHHKAHTLLSRANSAMTHKIDKYRREHPIRSEIFGVPRAARRLDPGIVEKIDFDTKCSLVPQHEIATTLDTQGLTSCLRYSSSSIEYSINIDMGSQLGQFYQNLVEKVALESMIPAEVRAQIIEFAKSLEINP